MEKLKFDARIGRYNLQISNPEAMSPCPIILKRAKEKDGGGRRADSPRLQTGCCLYSVQAPDTTSMILNSCQPGSLGPRPEKRNKLLGTVCVVYSSISVS